MTTALRTLPGRRRRLDAIPTKLHCSVIGTCLTLTDLRKLAAKGRFGLPPGASDYRLHGVVVQNCVDSGFAKVVTRLLDRRFAVHIGRFARAESESALEVLWTEALAAGDIPGAYWAVVSHPCDCSALRERAYGEVHMLSHLSGASQRADLRRLTEVERERDRLRADLEGTREAAGRLRDRLAALESDLRAMAIHQRRAESLERRLAELESGAALEALRHEARTQRDARDAAELRADSLERRLAARDEALAGRDHEVRRLERRVADMDGRLRDLHAGQEEPGTGDRLDLHQQTILYVGGASRTAAHLEAIVLRANGRFDYHDGGLDDGCPRLAGAVARADAVLCPVTCISHEAVGHIKRNCRKSCKRFIPLPGHSVSAFVRGLRTLDTQAPDLAAE
jgi:hypothetical protein